MYNPYMFQALFNAQVFLVQCNVKFYHLSYGFISFENHTLMELNMVLIFISFYELFINMSAKIYVYCISKHKKSNKMTIFTLYSVSSFMYIIFFNCLNFLFETLVK